MGCVGCRESSKESKEHKIVKNEKSLEIQKFSISEIK